MIGAATNNERGVAGIDWRCRILPVRAVAGPTSAGRDDDLAWMQAAFDKARERYAEMERKALEAVDDAGELALEGQGG